MITGGFFEDSDHHFKSLWNEILPYEEIVQ